MTKMFRHGKRFGMVTIAIFLSGALLLGSVVPAEAAEERVVKIGLHGVLAGALANTGVPFAYSIMDYARYFNEQGGINGIRVEVIWEETGRSPVVQGITTHKRFKQAGVVAEVNMISGACEVLAPTLRRDGIPITLITAISEAMASKPPWVFSAEASMDDGGAVLATAIKQTWFPDKHVRLALMIYDHLSGWAPIDGVRWAIGQGLDMEIVGVEVVPFLGAIDTTTEWMRTASKEPDVVLQIICGASLTTSVKDCARLGINKKGIILFDSGYCLEETVPVAGVDAWEGWYTYGGNPYAVETELPAMRTLLEVATQYRGWKPQDVPGCYIKGWIQAAVTVEGIRLAIEKVGFENLTGRAVRNGLASIKDFDAGGLMPPMSMDDTHPWWFPGVRVCQVREGRIWPISEKRFGYPGIAVEWFK